MATKRNHSIHKYHRVAKVAGQLVWSCALPDCNHHMPKHMEDTLLGKRSLCTNCGEESIILTEEILRHINFPVCEDCKKRISDVTAPITSVTLTKSDINEGLVEELLNMFEANNEN